MDLLSFELVDLDPDPDPHKMNAGSETAVKKAMLMRIHDETVRIEIFAAFLC
jgi:hypothetical protein